MLFGFLVLFREALEAVLIIGIVLGLLVKIGQGRYTRSVLAGAAAGVGLSVFAGILLGRAAGGLSERAEGLFEGVTMLFAASLLTSVILWMRNQRNPAEELRKQVVEKTKRGRKIGLFFLSFFSILREGVEAVIFLAASSFAAEKNTLVGAVLGIAAAMLIGSLVFFGSLRINMRKFFTVMSLVLIFFAAGLVALGIHELQEAGALPVFVERLWNINPKITGEGSYPLMHEKGAVGGILKGLFGYDGDPSLLEAAAYAAYLFVIFSVWGMKERSRHSRMALRKARNRRRRPSGAII